jgi:hypothetical protein
MELAYRIAGSEDFVRRSEDITITILDNIHCSVFYLKREVSRMDSVSVFRSAARDYLFILGPPEYVPHEAGGKIQHPKHRVLNKRQDDG